LNIKGHVNSVLFFILLLICNYNYPLSKWLEQHLNGVRTCIEGMMKDCGMIVVQYPPPFGGFGALSAKSTLEPPATAAPASSLFGCPTPPVGTIFGALIDTLLGAPAPSAFGTPVPLVVGVPNSPQQQSTQKVDDSSTMVEQKSFEELRLEDDMAHRAVWCTGTGFH
jgi:hypothetical protein